MSTQDERPAADAPERDLSEQGADGTAAAAELAIADQPEFALERAPIIDSLNPRQLALLQAKAPTLNHAELGQAMELAWAYRLDPYSGEIWFAKSKSGKLLIMVGRDGLRKIAQRNGLDVDGDVVRSKDTFAVRRGPDRARVVVHEYEGADEAHRGQIVGAWAECWDRKSGAQRGFFFAPIGEYRPANADSHSPWSKQVSVMTLAAAERQAVRQATPLSGLLVEGEDVLVNENERRDLVAADGSPAPAVLDGVPLREEVVATLDRARRLGHVGLSDQATAEMTLRGQSEERVRTWLDEAAAELDQMEVEPEPVDAEVVEEPEPRRAESIADAREPETRAPEPAPEVSPPEVDADVEAEHAAMRDRASALLDEAAEARESGDVERADGLEAEAEALRDAAGDPPPSDAQPELEF